MGTSLILEKLNLHFWRVGLLPDEDAAFVAGREAEMVEGLDVHTLVDVLTEEGGPIIRWYVDGPIYVATACATLTVEELLTTSMRSGRPPTFVRRYLCTKIQLYMNFSNL